MNPGNTLDALSFEALFFDKIHYIRSIQTALINKNKTMHKLNILFLTILSLLFTDKAFAQSDAFITKVVQNGQRMELTIIGSGPFRVGGNIHILHIGKKDFSLSKQKNAEGKGIITFYIPIEEFNALTEGEYVWMSYGNKFNKAPDPAIDPATFCKENPRTCWALGKFSKTTGGK
jgi:hypothetical protein